MKIEKFEDILAWQKGRNLFMFINNLFKGSKNYSFKDQIQRASLSVCNNIAEGFERRSNNEFKHFLYIAKGSCGEVRSMAYLALESKYLNQKEFEFIHANTTEISKILSGLIKTL